MLRRMATLRKHIVHITYQQIVEWKGVISNSFRYIQRMNDLALVERVKRNGA